MTMASTVEQGYDPWKLEPTDESHSDIEGRFRPTLVKRAKKRVVTPINGKLWCVAGDSRLGDSLRQYEVELVGRRYRCDCYLTPHGDSRAKSVCSHVLAVILYRRDHKVSGVSGVSGVVDVDEQQEVTTANTETPYATPPIRAQEAATQLSLECLDSVEQGQREPTVSPTSVSAPDAPFTNGVTNSVTNSVPTVDDPMWARGDGNSEPLPEWVEELREHQWRAVEEIVQAYDDGAEIVWLDAPTGSGKTLIAELVRRVMRARALYVCSSKSLQDQFLRDYPYSKVLKGRSNYPTVLMDWPGVTAADCTKPDCVWCPEVSECPYERAKSAALDSGIAVVNTSYFLTEANFVGNFGQRNARDLVIVDECDVLERELMGFVEFSVSEGMLKSLRVDAPKKGSHKTTIQQWIVDELIPAVVNGIKKVPRGSRDVKDIRRLESLSGLRAKATRLYEALEEEGGGENWVRDNDAGPLVMKPVRVSDAGEQVLWRHGRKWLCMSATIVSAEELGESLGVGDRDSRVVRVPMTFPVENRRVHVAPVANMIAKEKDTAWPNVCRAIARVLERHPDERTLIHTVSYDLTKYLRDGLRNVGVGREIVSYTDASSRSDALSRFLDTPGSVLLAPSFDRGIDLRGDDCRVVIVAKIPFPYLGDKQVSARMRLPGGQGWYAVQTVRTLVQMTGRGVRSEDDWCVTYVLDKQMVSNVWKKSKQLLPKWWVEAVDMSFPTKELMSDNDPRR